MQIVGLLQYLFMWTVTLALATVVISLSLLGLRNHAYRPIVLWCRLLHLCTGVRYRISGRELVPATGGLVIIANHASHLDGPTLIAALPRPIYFVIKKELTRIPLWGAAVVRAGFIPIDRSDSERARRQLQAAVDAIAGGRCVLVFPEGTRSPGEEMLPFKKGGFHLAVAAQVPILPIAINGSRALWPKEAFAPRAGCFDISVGHPIPTAGLNAGDVDDLCRRTRSAIATLQQRDSITGGDPPPP